MASAVAAPSSSQPSIAATEETPQAAPDAASPAAAAAAAAATAEPEAPTKGEPKWYWPEVFALRTGSIVRMASGEFAEVVEVIRPKPAAKPEAAAGVAEPAAAATEEPAAAATEEPAAAATEEPAAAATEEPAAAATEEPAAAATEEPAAAAAATEEPAAAATEEPAAASSSPQLVVHVRGAPAGEATRTITDLSELHWLPAHSSRRAIGSRVLTVEGAGKVVAERLSDEEWAYDVDVLTGSNAGKRVTHTHNKVHDRMHLLPAEHLDAAAASLSSGGAMVASARKAPPAQRPSVLREACKLFRTGFTHLSAARVDALDAAGKARHRSLRSKTGWQLAVASAHTSQWEQVVKAVEEMVDADAPESRKLAPAALKLLAQAHIALKDYEAAEAVLTDRTLQGDAKATELLKSARSLKKTRDAKDSKAWSKAFKNMGKDGTMSQGRGTVPDSVAGDALEQVLGARRSMQTSSGAKALAPAAREATAQERSVPSQDGALSAKPGAEEAELAAPEADDVSAWYLVGGLAVVGGMLAGMLAVRHFMSSR
ncbi:hypothetical protein FNF28_01052 [Cafeteria roenbergensis]|nr:hypothetical protein FNF28_01052 [Cafeteria roenbergensis]